MNAEVKQVTVIDHDTQQPVEAKTTTALALVTKSIAEINAVESTIAGLENKYRGVVFQVQTSDGMKEACKARAEIRAPRYQLQNMQKAAKAPLNELKRSIDEQTEDFIERIEAIEDPIHLQISTEEKRKEDEKKAREEAERKRVAAIQERFEQIRDQVGQAVGEPAAAIQARIQALVALEIDDTFAELKKQAEGARETTLIRLRAAEAKQIALEEEQERIRQERVRLAEEEARQAAERKRIAEEEARARAAREEEERLARVAREEEETRAREAREAEERRLTAERELAEARLGEIQGLQHQVYIATTGRLGVRKGGTRECILETLLETEAWEITEEKFGPLLPMAREAKISAIAQIREQLNQWDRRVADEERLAAERRRQEEEAARLAAERAEAERLENERKAANAAEEQRLADERARLQCEQEELQRLREAGTGAPGGATASEGDDSNSAKAPTEPVMESRASSISGPETTSSQGDLIDPMADLTVEQLRALLLKSAEYLRQLTQRCEACSGSGEIIHGDPDHERAEECNHCAPIWKLIEQIEPRRAPSPPVPVQTLECCDKTATCILAKGHGGDCDDDIPF